MSFIRRLLARVFGRRRADTPFVDRRRLEREGVRRAEAYLNEHLPSRYGPRSLAMPTDYLADTPDPMPYAAFFRKHRLPLPKGAEQEARIFELGQRDATLADYRQALGLHVRRHDTSVEIPAFTFKLFPEAE